MKIGPVRVLGEPVHLPTEIIETIAMWVACFDDIDARQCSLWSISLVARDWYNAAIKHLYASPQLHSRNFDLFTRTICPSLRSRGRATGLEDLVTELRMGGLAYVTTSSMTARVLRRVKKSLTLFEGPSHSMSTSSLAPISKLTSLQHLDLSKDKYDFGLDALLRAVHPLGGLTTLSLPRYALHHHQSEEDWSTLSWPLALEYLQSNYGTPGTDESWRMFLQSLPPSLHTLSFQHIRSYEMTENVTASGVKVPQISNLIVGVHAGELVFYGRLSIYNLLRTFPSLVKLEIPGSIFGDDECFSYSGTDLGERLETMTVGEDNEWYNDSELQGIDKAFVTLVERLARLHRVNIQEGFKKGNQKFLNICDSELAGRWPGVSDEDKGIFILPGEKPGPGRRWREPEDLQAPIQPAPTVWFPTVLRS
jgi:hypothetical protein